MFNRLFVLTTLIAGLLCSPSHAAFMPTDWKAISDASATLDTATGLEWLDLTETDGLSINQVISKLDTDYAGWRLPTVQEVSTLLFNFFGLAVNESDKTYANAASTEDAMRWQGLFGVTDVSGGRSYGKYINDNGYSVFAGTRDSLTIYFNYLRSFNLDNTSNYDGVFFGQ